MEVTEQGSDRLSGRLKGMPENTEERVLRHHVIFITEQVSITSLLIPLLYKNNIHGHSGTKNGLVFCKLTKC